MSTEKPYNTTSSREIENVRHNVNLIRSQLRAGRIDGEFLLKQLAGINTLLDKIEFEQKQQTAAGRFEALYNVSRVLGSSLDLQVVLDQVMDAIIQLSGAERGFLMLRDDDGGLSVKVARNLDRQTLRGEEFKFSRTIANQVLDEGQPILTTNAAEDPRFSGQASIVGQSLRSIMAVPLRARGNVFGVAYVDSRAMAGLFNNDDLAMLDALSGQAAVALDNARLFSVTDQQLAMRVEELQQLRRVDLQLNETLEADKAMLYTLEWACRVSDATSGHLGLVETDPPHVAAIHHYGEEVAHPVHLEETYAEVWQVVESGNPLILGDGQYGADTVLIVPVLRERRVIGAVILRRDGADSFTSEQQDLAQRVVARAAVAIENARLYDAVRAADKAKSEFVGIVAHDLKAPMTSISGYSELMLMQGDNLIERQREFLTRIQDTVKRMEILVSDLADISRIESGHFFMEQTRVPVKAIVQAVKDGTLPEVQKRKHEFIENVEDDLPDMWTDYYRLLQVLTNFVSNAYKYTPDGGKILFDVHRVDDNIAFSVRDTGIGLSEENIRKLGTKFWRAEDDFTRSQPGTGLGFAITRSLVEQMGSKIEIESEIDKGSTFKFSIAIAD